MNLIERDLSCT